MNIKKKSTMLVFIMIIIIIIIFIIIMVLSYIFNKNGNNYIKTDEDFLEYILNIKEYELTADVTVTSNKNVNKYVIKQKLEKNKSIQEILEPENIAGLITEYDGNNLKIINSKINLVKIYQNYNYIVADSLWINSFLMDFNKKYEKDINKKNFIENNISANNDEIILELKDENANVYNCNKKLYIDKKTKKPSKMIVQDINKNTTIYILYSEIEIS